MMLWTKDRPGGEGEVVAVLALLLVVCPTDDIGSSCSSCSSSDLLDGGCSLSTRSALPEEENQGIHLWFVGPTDHHHSLQLVLGSPAVASPKQV